MEDDDSYQQEDGAEDGVQKKLHGGLGGAFAAVPGDEEVHGDEDDFEAEEEEEEVEGEEGAKDGRFKEEEPGVEGLVPVREEEREEGDAGGQQDEGEADAIDADEVLRPQGRDPGRLFDPLEAAGGIEVGE